MSEAEVTSPPTLHLSSGPHIASGRTTAQIMWMVNLSLLPALNAARASLTQFNPATALPSC